MRRAPLLLLVLACAPAAEPVDLVALCNEVGDCIEGGCLGLREVMRDVAAERPECFQSCVDCTECEALPESQAWLSEYMEARAAWAACVEVCTNPFTVDELSIEKSQPRCGGAEEVSEYCAVAAAYNATVGADDPDVMGQCSDVAE